MHFTHDYRSFRNVLGPIEKEWTADTIDMHKIVDRTENLFLGRRLGRGAPPSSGKSDYAADGLWLISDSVRAVSEQGLGSFHSVLHDSCIGQHFGAPTWSEIAILAVLGPFGSF